MTWIKKYIDPLIFSTWKILLIDSLEKWVEKDIYIINDLLD
jgi:hypothetical protein